MVNLIEYDIFRPCGAGSQREVLAMKKWIAAVLALVMAFGLAVPALAADGAPLDDGVVWEPDMAEDVPSDDMTWQIPGTEAPPAEETPVPTAEPTATPDKARITEAYIENGGTVVKIENISDGLVIAAEYDASGALKNFKMLPLNRETNGGAVIIDGIEADKVFVWNKLDTAQPLCEAAEVRKD